MRPRLFPYSLFAVALLAFTPAMLAQTPAITSVQSGTPSSTSPNHGNAVTAGAPYGYIYLYLNGSFDPQLFSHVEWKNTTTGELELIV